MAHRRMLIYRDTFDADKVINMVVNVVINIMMSLVVSMVNIAWYCFL